MCIYLHKIIVVAIKTYNSDKNSTTITQRTRISKTTVAATATVTATETGTATVTATETAEQQQQQQQKLPQAHKEQDRPHQPTWPNKLRAILTDKNRGFCNTTQAHKEQE